MLKVHQISVAIIYLPVILWLIEMIDDLCKTTERHETCTFINRHITDERLPSKRSKLVENMPSLLSYLFVTYPGVEKWIKI